MSRSRTQASVSQHSRLYIYYIHIYMHAYVYMLYPAGVISHLCMYTIKVHCEWDSRLCFDSYIHAYGSENI